jgi:prevent-host-death family protein
MLVFSELKTARPHLETAMPTKSVTLDEASNQLPELVARASRGEEIVIEQDAHPLARLVPCADTAGERVFGQSRGRIHAAEDFDDPLADDFWLGSSRG